MSVYIENERLPECQHLSLGVDERVFDCSSAPRVASVLPIINNIFTVDMSAFFQSSDFIFSLFFSRKVFFFFSAL